MRKIVYFMLIVFAFSACNSGSKNYTIKGTLTGADSGKIFLVKVKEGQPVVVDTAEIAKGSFELKGSAGLPEMHYLRMNEREYFAQFFLENGKITVVANKDSLQNTKVTGSKTNDLFNVYIAEIERLNKEYAGLREQYNQAMMKGDMESANKAKIDVEAMMENMNVFARNFVLEHRNSMVAPFIYLSQFINEASSEELDTITGIFPAEFAESVYVEEINRIAGLKKKTAIGSPAPDFTMNDPEGKPVSLSSFRGKYLLIDFWASWCAPCRQENPNVVRMYNKFKDKGFDILGVSLDRDKESWLKGVTDDQLSWTHVSDLQYWQNEVAVLYGVQSIPHTILLDKDGKIIAKNLRGADLEAKLTSLLEE
ncbi:MAG: TlpA disulfide reductase family protein [Prolixibacteraceae bacterium]|jgi:peroxiredoxin|nr:TlpA disulfide reductase family protein [Prolixibacteraceae bacterium]